MHGRLLKGNDQQVGDNKGIRYAKVVVIVFDATVDSWMSRLNDK